jgi:ribosomal protein L18
MTSVPENQIVKMHDIMVGMDAIEASNKSIELSAYKIGYLDALRAMETGLKNLYFDKKVSKFEVEVLIVTLMEKNKLTESLPAE